LLDDLHLSLECDALDVAIALIHGRKVANGATKCGQKITVVDNDNSNIVIVCAAMLSYDSLPDADPDQNRTFLSEVNSVQSAATVGQLRECRGCYCRDVTVFDFFVLGYFRFMFSFICCVQSLMQQISDVTAGVICRFYAE